MTKEELEKLKHAPAIDGVLEIILQRWSPRAFADREVAPEDLKKLFEAASWAGSSFNEQPWRFLVGRRGDEAYGKIFDSLMEANRGWAKNAPVLVLSLYKKTFSHNGSPNRVAFHDIGAATAYLSLQATALGMHTHSMAGFSPEKARASFGFSDDFDTGSVTAIGYLGDPATLPEPLRKMEEAPRNRKPIEQVVFSAWEEAAKF